MKLTEIYKKYQARLLECQDIFNLDVKELQDKDITAERREWLKKDMDLLNVQIGAYECIVKDLGEIV